MPEALTPVWMTSCQQGGWISPLGQVTFTPRTIGRLGWRLRVGVIHPLSPSPRHTAGLRAQWLTSCPCGRGIPLLEECGGVVEGMGRGSGAPLQFAGIRD